MPTLVRANTARHAFTSSALPENTFSVVCFRGKEEMAGLYRFTIDLVSRDPDLPLEEVVGQPAVLSVLREYELGGPLPAIGEPTFFHGVVTQLVETGRTPDRTFYRAVLEPRLSGLRRVHQSRVFQHQSVEDIVAAVLKEHELAGDDVAIEIGAALPQREYCVQYQETDLAFVSRLLEHEGIGYFFRQTADREVLVVTDQRAAHPPLDLDATLVYRQGSGLVPDRGDHVETFSAREALTTGRVRLKDYNDRTPRADLTAEATADADMPGLHYEYGPHYADAAEGQRLAKARGEGFAQQRRVFEGTSDCAGLRAGYTFTLEDHFRPAFNQEYLLTRITHHGAQGGAPGPAGPAGDDGDGAADHATVYGNTFTAIPARVPFRPEQRTPVPKVYGLLTATVESGGGDYAYLDEDGRYRARMPFDLGEAAAGNATLPIRMAQPNSGPGYGVHFPNHAGAEMVFACIDGDVDRPLALGTVPNPEQASPATAANRTQSVIRTWGQNELSFDDLKGQEKILLRATKDHTEEVANDQSVSVGNNQSVTVQAGRTKSVGGAQSESVGGDKSIQVEGTHTETIKGATTITVAEGAYAHDVAAATADYHVSGPVREQYDATQETTVEGDIQITSNGGAVQVSAQSQLRLVCGAGAITITPDGAITIEGTSITVEGKTLDLAASGPMTLNGSVVDVN